MGMSNSLSSTIGAGHAIASLGTIGESRDSLVAAGGIGGPVVGGVNSLLSVNSFLGARLLISQDESSYCAEARSKQNIDSSSLPELRPGDAKGAVSLAYLMARFQKDVADCTDQQLSDRLDFFKKQSAATLRKNILPRYPESIALQTRKNPNKEKDIEKE